MVQLSFLCLFLRLVFSDAAERILNCVSSQASVQCYAHYFSQPGECSLWYLSARFPELYDLDGEASPEKPHQLQLTPFERLYDANHKYYNGVNITVQPPTKAGVNHVKGFEITYNQVDVDGRMKADGHLRCIVIKPSSQIKGNMKKLKFSFEVYPLARGLYPFIVYSLPKPELTEGTERMHQQAAVFIPQFGYEAYQASMFWHTTITYRVEYDQGALCGTIYFSFHGSAQHSFPAFHVQLFSAGKYDSVVAEMKIPEDQLPGEHMFGLLNQGKYEIKATPVDPFRRDVCQDDLGYFTRCTVSSTNVINIGTTGVCRRKTRPEHTEKRTTTSLSKPAVTPSTSNNSSGISKRQMEQLSSNTTRTDKAISGILGTVLAIFLIAVGLYCAYNCRRRKSHDLWGNSKRKEGKSYIHCISNTYSKQQKPVSVPCREFSSDKIMVIVYHAINKFHEDAVLELGTYLQENWCVTVHVERCPTESEIVNQPVVLKTPDLADILFVLIGSPPNSNICSYNNNQEENGDQLLLNYLDYIRYQNKHFNGSYIYTLFDYPIPLSRQLCQKERFQTTTFCLSPDMDKFLNFVQSWGIKARPSQRSKSQSLSYLEKIINLAILYFVEESNGTLSSNQVGSQDMRSSEKWKSPKYVPLEQEYTTTAFSFDPPSDNSCEDIATIVILEEIEHLNKRNLSSEGV